MLKSQQRYRNEVHNVFTEKVSKICSNHNDGKRLQTFDEIASYPYRINTGSVQLFYNI